MSEDKTIESILAERGLYIGKTIGRSMRPMLRQGKDTIILSPKKGRLKKYDVPLYRRGEAYVLHRVIEVRETDYVICGDNCYAKEYGITDEDIVGVLTGFRRGERYVSLTSPFYRLYSRVHVALYPIRAVWLRFRSFLACIYHRFCRKKGAKSR